MHGTVVRRRLRLEIIAHAVPLSLAAKDRAADAATREVVGHRMPCRPGGDAAPTSAEDGVGPSTTSWRVIALELLVEILDQPRLAPLKLLLLITGQRCQGINKYPPPGNVHHRAGVDPAARTPGEPDAPFEHGGRRRMEAISVRADSRTAGRTNLPISIRDRLPGPDLEPSLPLAGCSSHRHTEHSSS